MILARCPACSTTFRVRPEQLRARQGRVRCGQCNHAFNALEALVDEGITDPAAPAAVSPSEPALFVLEEKPPAEIAADQHFDPYDTWPPTGLEADDVEPAAAPPVVQEGEIEPIIEFGAVEPESTPQSSADEDSASADIFSVVAEDNAADESPLLPILEDGRQEPGGEILAEEWPPRVSQEPTGIDLTADLPEPDIFAVPAAPESPVQADPEAIYTVPDTAFSGDDEAWPPSASVPISDDAPSIGLDTPAPAPSGDSDASPPADASPIAFALPEAEMGDPPVDFDTLIHTRDPGQAVEPLARAIGEVDLASAPAPEPQAPDENDEPDTTDAADAADAAEARGEPFRQALWAAAATLLTLAVLAQGVLVFRNEIALSSPEMRPALESLCAGLGCELPLPRHAADIAIESSDIQPDASREAYFTLHATLRNRAAFQQAWPHVEITLTDARDKALVRRVLAPAQWLPADAPKEAFPTKGEVAIRVAFEAPGVAAAGYRVYAFYP